MTTDDARGTDASEEGIATLRLADYQVVPFRVPEEMGVTLQLGLQDEQEVAASLLSLWQVIPPVKIQNVLSPMLVPWLFLCLLPLNHVVKNIQHKEWLLAFLALSSLLGILLLALLQRRMVCFGKRLTPHLLSKIRKCVNSRSFQTESLSFSVATALSVAAALIIYAVDGCCSTPLAAAIPPFLIFSFVLYWWCENNTIYRRMIQPQDGSVCDECSLDETPQ